MGPNPFFGPGNPPALKAAYVRPVKAAVKTKNFELARLALHDANSAFGGLGPGGQEEALVQMRGQHADQSLGRVDARRVQALIVVQQFGGCRLYRLHQMRMAVPDIGDQHPRRPVEERVAVNIGYHHTQGVVPGHRSLVAGTLRFGAGPAGKQFPRTRSGQRTIDVSFR